MVLISAEPEGHTPSQPTRELEAIRTAVEAGTVKFRRESIYHATRESVMSGIEENLPRVVHWHSHGVRDGVFIEGEDGAATQIDEAWLVDVIGACRETRLVVLSACESIHLAEALATSPRTTVLAAIAWTVPVPNTHARSFSAALYKQIARGKPVVAAFEFARLTLETKYQGVVKLVPRAQGADFWLYERAPELLPDPVRPDPPPSPDLPPSVPLRLRVLVGMLVAGMLALTAYTLWDVLFPPPPEVVQKMPKSKSTKDTSVKKADEPEKPPPPREELLSVEASIKLVPRPCPAKTCPSESDMRVALERALNAAVNGCPGEPGG